MIISKDPESKEQGIEGAASYGRYYFGVEAANNTVIMFYADEVAVEAGGSLCAYRKLEDGRQLTLAWAPGRWSYFWAASVVDGQVLAMELIHKSDSMSPKKAAKKGAAK
jgi:hypothetical protein